MGTKLSKTEVKKLLVSERKSMRDKQKQSLFMRRTLSIYNGMKKRATESQQEIGFSLRELRGYIGDIPSNFYSCAYCGDRLKNSTFAVDHATPISRGGGFEMSNLAICCKPCNWQKGALASMEFTNLLGMIEGLPPEAAADVKRRLTIGGRWGWK